MKPPVPPPSPAAAVAQPLAEQLSPCPPSVSAPRALPVEIGGREGPEPTRYGDWERAGRCIDF